MATLTYNGSLEIIRCGVCHIPFAMPAELYRRVRRTGDDFWCPAGHQIHYYEDENTRLKAELDRAQADARWQRDRAERNHAEAEHQASRANGYKGALTKVKKRIGNGVCPCCNRHFANVERHMKSQHPSFGDPA